jgi:bifunctional DNase/RNase
VDGVQPLDVVGVRVEMPSNQPIVLLREIAGERYLPIWIGAVEATAIAFAQQGVVPARPMTHDLLRDVLDALGAELRQIRITELRDGVFYAVLVFGSGAEVSARPSDAIALALRTGTPIFGAEAVLDEAGIVIEDEQEDEVERFIEFLDQITPEDFGAEGGPEGGAPGGVPGGAPAGDEGGDEGPGAPGSTEEPGPGRAGGEPST